MSKPRRHHYVQEAHLKMFESAEGKLHVCGKDGRRFETSADGIFKERDLYAFSDGEDVNVEFEAGITRVEGKLFPALREVAESKALTPEADAKLRVYMALSAIRSPVVRDGVHEAHVQAVRTFARIMEEQGDLQPFQGGEIIGQRYLTDLISEGLVNVTINNSRFLDILQGAFPRIAEQLRGLRLSLLISRSGRLVIGDHPLTFFHPCREAPEIGFVLGGPSCEVAFPVSSRVCVLGRWGEPFPPSDSEEAVFQVNRRQAIFATRHVASQSRLRRVEGLMHRYARLRYAAEISTIPRAGGGDLLIYRRDILPEDEWQRIRQDIRPIAGLL
jgi:hypothetical protein